MPILTVAIPTFNGARHLAEALVSVLDQDGADFEVLVCDDRSDDDTVEVARQIAGDRARVEVNPERLGLAGNWNHCVERSRTPWVAVFHQDDLMRPGHLASQARMIADRPELGMVCCAAEVIDEAGRPVDPKVVEPGGLGHEDRVYPAGTFARELAVGNPVRCSTVSLRKESHTALGGFDGNWRYVVDWDFWARLGERYAVAWCATPSVAVRWHGGSETHRFKTGTLDLEEQERLLRRIHHELGADSPGIPGLRAAAARRLARAYLNRAYDTAGAGDRGLSLDCLRRALRLSPALIGRLVRDPRLAARLALGRRGPRPL